MLIGIIGTRWGRTHIGTFRHWGHEVCAILGRDATRTRRVAAEEGIPLATTQFDDLEAADVIVIASPPATHRELIYRFRHKYILCEKPLCAAPHASIDDAVAMSSERVFVNYAFPFLQTARHLREVIRAGEIGDVLRVSIDVAINLSAQKSPQEWFFEVATHPLYFVFHLFGPFNLIAQHVIGNGPINMSTILDASGKIINVNVCQAVAEGIAIDLKIIGSKGDIATCGGFALHKPWNFSPLLVSGRERYAGEHSTDSDIWYQANCQSVKTFLNVVEGRINHSQALAHGLADYASATAMEAPFAAIWRPDAAGR